MSVLGLFFGLLFFYLMKNAISGTMAATDLVAMRDAVVEVDIGGVDTWVAIETWATMVEPTRGTVPTSEEKNLAGTNFIGYGSAGNATVKVTGFATEGSTDPLANVYAQLGAVVDVRWSKSGAGDELRWYTSQGVVTQCDPPGFDANGNQSAKFSFTITAADILKETIPT